MRSEFIHSCIIWLHCRYILDMCPFMGFLGLIFHVFFMWVGVQKERMLPEDMYVLSPNGSILCTPSPKPYPHKPPKCSDCGPLFMKVSVLCASYKHYTYMDGIKLAMTIV